MRRRRIQLWLLLTMGAGLVAAATLGLAQRPRGLPNTSIETPYGPVSWNHEIHARLPEFNCQVCHHMADRGATSPESCTNCHVRLNDPDKTVVIHHEVEGQGMVDEVKKASPAMIAFHNKCLGCHKAVLQGPIACRECHRLPSVQGRQKASEMTESDGPSTVVLSHLVEEYEPVEFDHATHAADYSEGCADCHHHHSEVEATPPCRACHQTRRTQTGARLPGLQDAYHAQCINCHKKNEAGPMDCEDCHSERESEGEVKLGHGPDVARLGQLTAVYEGVEFNHEEHVEYAENCQTCHHHATALEKVPPCRECHNRAFTPKGERKLGLVDAYHSQCIKCHLDNDGPRECDGCHAIKPAK